ncbi:hypothetical protein THAOC_27343, partial [Thalassiosira oceanica]
RQPVPAGGPRVQPPVPLGPGRRRAVPAGLVRPPDLPHVEHAREGYVPLGMRSDSWRSLVAEPRRHPVRVRARRDESPVEEAVRVQCHVQHQHERVEGAAVVHRRGERGGVAREDGHGGVRTDEQLVRRPEREEKRPDDDQGVHEGALDHSTFPRGMSFLRPPSSIEEETTKMENGITLASTLLL